MIDYGPAVTGQEPREACRCAGCLAESNCRVSGTGDSPTPADSVEPADVRYSMLGRNR